MAEVVLARQQLGNGVERTVVIKRVLPHIAADPEFVRMFAIEIRLAQRLRHPNIVQVIDAHSEGGAPYLVLEALFGADIRTLIRESNRRSTRISPAIACAIVAQAARGLHYAHTLADECGSPLRIVHRDVSPQNIFVTRDGSVRVIDFGIAKSAEQIESTRTGTTKGKPGYMSPEQLRGQRAIDARVDVYALGVVLWELLAGKRLWKRDSDIASAMAILQETPPKPSSQSPRVTAALDALTLAMLAQKPADRPSMDEVERRLEVIARDLRCFAPRAAVAALLAELIPEQDDGFEAATVATGSIDVAEDEHRDDRAVATPSNSGSTAAHVIDARSTQQSAPDAQEPVASPLGARPATGAARTAIAIGVLTVTAMLAAFFVGASRNDAARSTHAARQSEAQRSFATSQDALAPATPVRGSDAPLASVSASRGGAESMQDASAPSATATPDRAARSTTTRAQGHGRTRGLSTRALFSD